jgi:plastocyanin
MTGKVGNLQASTRNGSAPTLAQENASMTRLTSVLLACTALALVAAGCGGGNKSSSGASTSTSTPSSSSSGEVVIKMQNIQFDPKAVTVKVGQKVKWVNEDSVAHDVTSQSGETIKSPTFGHGGSFEFTPNKAGEIKYVCTLHPGMDATLTVQ